MRTEDDQIRTFISAVRIASREKGSWFRLHESYEAVAETETEPGDLVWIQDGTETVAAEVTAVYQAKMQDLPYSSYTIKKMNGKLNAEEVPVDYRFLFEEQEWEE